MKAAGQQGVPIREFAKAMLAASPPFADRVRRFEAEFGPAGADTLAVLAQASFFCWGNAEYQKDLAEVCLAIASERPTSFSYHRQVTPRRWARIHTYVVGVQRWLGGRLPLPVNVDRAKVEQIQKWLGARNPAKEALAQLLLWRLVDHVLNLSLARLAGDVGLDDTPYANFTEWYARPDGTRYAGGDAEAFLEDCTRRVREALKEAPADAERLIGGLLEPSPPPCGHRFTRYLDIQITSIGALKWRGHLPPDDVPKARWQAFVDQARAALAAWLDGAPPSGATAIVLYEALGTPAARSRATVRTFLLAEDRLNRAAWDWLMARAEKDGTTARAAFRL